MWKPPSYFHAYPKVSLQNLLGLVKEFTHEENLVRRRVEHKKESGQTASWAKLKRKKETKLI